MAFDKLAAIVQLGPCSWEYRTWMMKGRNQKSNALSEFRGSKDGLWSHFGRINCVYSLIESCESWELHVQKCFNTVQYYYSIMSVAYVSTYVSI